MENHRRKNGKLLLCLLTVFMMVSTGFVAVVSASDNAAQPTADELGSEPREIEKQPISASDESSVIQETSSGSTTTEFPTYTSTVASDNGVGEPKNVQWANAQKDLKENVEDEEQRIEIDNFEIDDDTSSPDLAPKPITSGGSMFDNAIPNFVEDLGNKGTGTMGNSGPTPAVVTVDAGGPYGTPSNPLYEGMNVDFDGSLSGDDPALYDFRWDYENDGQFDTGWMPGDPDHSVMMDDNSVGEVLMQAWDGTWTYVNYDGEYWDGEYPNYLYYHYGYPNSVTGWRFTAGEDLTIDSVGLFRYWDSYRGYCPRYMHNVRIWDATAGGVLMNQIVGPFYPPSNTWTWYPFPTTSLTQGNDYVISVYANVGYYPSYYYPFDPFTGPTADGAIDPVRAVYGYGNSYPPYTRSTTYGPLIDLHYNWQLATMNTIEDTGDIFVDNVDPTIETLDIDPAITPEGAEVTLTGTMTDPGIEDEWQYRVCWGDAPYPEDCDEWSEVTKYGGGARILATASYSEYEWNAVIPLLSAYLGNFVQAFDIFDVYEEQEVPSVEMMLEYDIVIAGENYFIDAFRDDYGDALADYSDAGGNVLTAWVSDMDDYFYGEGGIEGRWRDDNYLIFEPDNLYFGWSNMGMIYDPTHPIFSGVGGVATYYSYWAYDVTPGTTRLADMNPYGRPFIGVKDNPAGSGGCISGISMLPHSWANTGDWVELFGNIIKWCSQQPDPYLLPQPLEFSASHVYVDDHPTHVTPVDLKDVKVELKDDDHEKCVLNCADYVVINEASLGIDWLEVFNFGGSPVDMTGWTVIFRDNRGYTPYIYTMPSFILDAGAYVVFHEYSGTNTATDLYVGFNIWWVEYTPYGGGAALIPTAASGYSCDFVRWNSGWTYPGCAWGPPDFDQDVSVYRAVDDDTDTGADWDTSGTATEGELNPGQTGNWPQPPDAVLLSGYDEATTDVQIENVMPTANAPPGVFTPVTNEMSIINFGLDKEMFTFSDPALREDTETFWWRWSFGDGTAMGNWEETNQIIPGAVGGNTLVTGIPLDFPCAYDYSEDGAQQLLTNFLLAGMPSGEGTILLSDTSWFAGPGIDGAFENTLNGNFGTNWDFIYTSAHEDLLDAGGNLLYDALYMSYDWAYYGPFYNADEIGDFVNAGGHLVVPGDEFDYGVLDFLPWFVEYSAFDPWTQFPGPEFVPCPLDICTDVATGDWGFNYELHNTIDDYDANEFIPAYADPDPITTLVRPGEARWPKNAVWPVQHIYGDNGIYTADLQLIDDDMYWDLSGPQPVYTGPAGEEDMWISHNYFDVEVYNTDPVIADVDVFVEGDLCLRLSGNKGNEATLHVDDGYGNSYELTLIRDPGNPEFACIEDLRISLKKTDGASVQLEYVPGDDDGSNPSWIVEGYWPGDDPHKIHVVFDAKKGPQMVDISFADLFLGVPINFEVSAGDIGTDDLAVVWNWGDVTPHGVHLYANDGGMVAGFSDESQRLFDQLPNRDPWFDRADNEVKSPWGSSIAVVDMQQHAYEDPYYYYAMVTVLDDDNGDGYPSPYATDGVDMEFFELNLV